jgi:hypothetical protein
LPDTATGSYLTPAAPQDPLPELGCGAGISLVLLVAACAGRPLLDRSGAAKRRGTRPALRVALTATNAQAAGPPSARTAATAVPASGSAPMAHPTGIAPRPHHP